jgi:regulator of sigma E protease
MFTNAISVIGAIIALGFMVTIHEFGHFIAARLFGVRVDVFSFGFGTRLFGIKRGHTDYSVRILPFGGYVRMAGDSTSEERTGAPDEFLSKPRWQRACILLAGPAMNALTALIVFAFYLGGVSQQAVYIDKPIEVAGVFKGSPADQAGIRSGDRIVDINGIENPTWERAHFEAHFTLPGNQLPVTIDRDGQQIHSFVHSAMDYFQMFGYPAEPVIVDTVTPASPAERAGLRPGDNITSFGGVPIDSFNTLTQLFSQNEDHPVLIGIIRAGHSMNLQVRPWKMDPGDGFGARWTIGIKRHIETQRVEKGPLESLGISLWFNARMAKQMLDLVGQLFVGKASLKDVSGPVGIVAVSGQAARAGIGSLISVMAYISLNLFVVNLLPIPILDGGHIVVLAAEGVLRHDLSLKVKERFLQVGFVFILVVFALVMYNDVVRVFLHS